MESELTLIRPGDLHRHNEAGGSWVVIHGKVYDLNDFRDKVIPPHTTALDSDARMSPHPEYCLPLAKRLRTFSLKHQMRVK